MRAIEVPEQSGKPRPGDEADLTSSIEPIRSRGYERRLRDLLQKTDSCRSDTGREKALTKFPKDAPHQSGKNLTAPYPKTHSFASAQPGRYRVDVSLQ